MDKMWKEEHLGKTFSPFPFETMVTAPFCSLLCVMDDSKKESSAHAVMGDHKLLSYIHVFHVSGHFLLFNCLDFCR